MDPLNAHTDYEFGGFRLDTTLQVLISPAGEVISLPARAYDALRYLVGHAGELADKAALMRAIWPATVVEENNLNQCILALRRALGETAGERRFILTVPGRGFKFVAPVRAVPAAREVAASEAPASEVRVSEVPTPKIAASEPPPPDAPRRRGPSRVKLMVAGSALLAVILAVVFALVVRSGPVTVPTEYEALTDLRESATAPALSRDGKMLAFIAGGSGFLTPGRIYVKALPDGQPTPLTKVLADVYSPAFSFDGTRVAFTYFTNGSSEPAWNTLTVPTTGGEPALLLGNAAGLTWIAPHQLLYSEIQSGIHMGIVTSAEDRAALKEIYFPSHERGMAHFSYLSPDRQSVLLVEMDRTGQWQRCRRVPFDGSSAGEQVGPVGSCTSAAWSPDGKWMYFSARVAGQSHLWRQRYPHGEPEQITFGPTDEQGVAVAPDGHSLVTSLGLVRQSIWIHDANGDRPLTSEAVAWAPWLSADAKRLYFLAARVSDAPSSLWRLDISKAQQEPMLPGLNVLSFDISHDEREVVFSLDHHGEMQIWDAPLDGHLPPRLLARGADEPAFDESGEVFFRLLGDKVNYLYRMQDDGSSRQRMLAMPILQFQSVSPTGKWASVVAVIDGQVATAILGLGTERFRWVRAGYWATRWSLDGRGLYVEVREASSAQNGQTLPITLTEGAPPQIPPLPLTTEEGLLPQETDGFAPGPDPSTYVFTRTERLRNIFRIPLHH